LSTQLAIKILPTEKKNYYLYKIISYMSEKDINRLLELAQTQFQEKVSKEEALRSLVRAGILDEAGNLTAPYANLAIPAGK
jgi:hypothetical protein